MGREGVRDGMGRRSRQDGFSLSLLACCTNLLITGITNPTREQRGIGHRLCPGGRDPAPESAGDPLANHGGSCSSLPGPPGPRSDQGGHTLNNYVLKLFSG